jgi:Ca2+-binding RTX toxin-like protein
LVNRNLTPIVGTDGEDYLLGTAFDGVLNGGLSDDTILGLAGDDILSGEEGDDRLNGGAGEDVLIVNPGLRRGHIPA